MAVDLADNVLTTTATAETVLGLSSGAGGDALTIAINQASQFIEDMLGRPLCYEADIEERVSSYELDFLRMDRAPIKALTSIYYDDNTDAEDISDLILSDLDKDDGVIRRDGGWGWSAQYTERITREQLPGTERPLWLVTYDAGWVTPHQVGSVGALARDLPQSIEAACLELVRYFYNLIGRDPSVTSERLLSYSVRYFGDATSTPIDLQEFPMVRQVLRRYKRRWINQ